MESYFFLPASLLRKLRDVELAEPDAIIIDFEDAILSSDIESYFVELKNLSNFSNYWFRLPIRNSFSESLDLQYIRKFTDLGINQIVLPKLKSINELIEITSLFKGLKLIVLIEHPRLLLEIKYGLMINQKVLDIIVGLGLGSHDLMTFLNAKHTEEQLDYPRKEVLYIAKAYGLIAIDIASMEVIDKESFVNEISYGVNNGYDAKFIIHPNQLTWIKNETKENTESLIWALDIMKFLPENYNGESLTPFILNGEVVEKPHALKALDIIRKQNNGK